MSNNKNCLINAMIIYIFSMYILFTMRPLSMYDSNNVLKGWDSININNPVTLHNVYVYTGLIAIFSHYMAREI